MIPSYKAYRFIPPALVHQKRPIYSQVECRLVADWLNGHDRPIVNMVPPERDPFMERLRNAPLVVYGK